MKTGDVVILSKHPRLLDLGKETIECLVSEYEIKSNVYLAASFPDKTILALTSPEGEPWNILTESELEGGKNRYFAIWQRQTNEY